jgi:hypothetical protein
MVVVAVAALAACDSPDVRPPVGETAVPSTSGPAATILPTDEPTRLPSAATAVVATLPATESLPPLTPTPFTWSTPAAAKQALSREPVSEGERLAVAELESNLAAARDDVALAMAYRGLTAVPDASAPLITEPLAVGTRQELNILNVELNIVNNVTVELLAVSDHAYFWFDSTPGFSWPDEAVLLATAAAFDDIYELIRLHFGSERSPGVDGDPRIHIVNASPLTVCDTVAINPTCGLQGYYAANHTLPVSVDPYSNERDMFVMNGSLFGGIRYLEVLGHEFRHMIEDNHDTNDWDWEVEGSAMLAEDLLGYSGEPIARANLFLMNPDQQLNRWSDGDTTPYYGQGYLLNRYLYTQLGPELYLDFATDAQPGFLALDRVAAENGLPFTGQSLWLDWLAALAVHDQPDAPSEYALGAAVNRVTPEVLDASAPTLDLTVRQFAADYYQLRGEGEAVVAFTGSNHVPLLPVLPLSGRRMWLANRANFSQASLTHAFDLTDVTAATLHYAVFHEIEVGYDFAYVAVSTDGGQTWQGLATAAMQGADPADDPSDSAFTERFYTGNSDGWVTETADLTPYTGQTIHLRFEYVTDPILTFGGLAVDNISIPEIGFYDDAESEGDWTAIGFVRATAYVPQQWHLQLISFGEGGPVVESLSLAADNTLSLSVPVMSDDGRRPILIIAASAPMTLETAHYQLRVE